MPPDVAGITGRSPRAIDDAMCDSSRSGSARRFASSVAMNAATASAASTAMVSPSNGP